MQLKAAGVVRLKGLIDPADWDKLVLYVHGERLAMWTETQQSGVHSRDHLEVYRELCVSNLMLSL